MVRRSRLWFVPALLAPLALVACGGGGSPPPPRPAPTGTALAYICPSSDSVASVAVASRTVGSAGSRRLTTWRGRAAASSGFVEVLYDRAVASVSTDAIAAREQKLNAVLVNSSDYPNLNVITHVLAVAPADVAATVAALRSQPGVRAVAVSGPRRLPSTVAQEYFTSDPYFNGFPAGNGQPATFHVAPYDESANVPGQWDMHAIRLGYAFAYSQANNGSGIQNANALGSNTVKIAMIDTGVDATHPELSSKVTSQRCFITNPSGAQSTSSFSTDPDGHGTDVTGIAAASTNNAFGYAAAGGNVVVYAYRVFPTPDDSCSGNTLATPGPLCSAEPADVASAIDDAVAKGVNVISLSLGGAGTTGSPACTGGVDSDPAEGAAINAAIAHNVIVVAAAGNDSTAALEAPACDTGVIAVGASALDDGQANGSHTSNGGSASAPTEYVASYSDYNPPGALPGSSSAWGIVAPGGDPVSVQDPDNLHWITDIWTTTPLDSNFAGDCTDDYPSAGTTPPVDCSTLIAGTSMSTPHVAGAAALILAVNSTYQSASKMKQLLCSTADDIHDAHEGCGRLNVYRAMAVALHDPSPP
jgi:subtilisin family serine protease